MDEKSFFVKFAHIFGVTEERVAEALRQVGEEISKEMSYVPSDSDVEEARKHVGNPLKTGCSIKGDCLACGSVGQAWVNPKRRFVYCFACKKTEALTP